MEKRPSLLLLELLLVSTNANTITLIYIATEVALVVYSKVKYSLQKHDIIKYLIE